MLGLRTSDLYINNYKFKITKLVCFNFFKEPTLPKQILNIQFMTFITE